MHSPLTRTSRATSFTSLHSSRVEIQVRMTLSTGSSWRK
jgi:hypothetical protein